MILLFSRISFSVERTNELFSNRRPRRFVESLGTDFPDESFGFFVGRCHSGGFCFPVDLLPQGATSAAPASVVSLPDSSERCCTFLKTMSTRVLGKAGVIHDYHASNEVERSLKVWRAMQWQSREGARLLTSKRKPKKWYLQWFCILETSWRTKSEEIERRFNMIVVPRVSAVSREVMFSNRCIFTNR